MNEQRLLLSFFVKVASKSIHNYNYLAEMVLRIFLFMAVGSLKTDHFKCQLRHNERWRIFCPPVFGSPDILGTADCLAPAPGTDYR